MKRKFAGKLTILLLAVWAVGGQGQAKPPNAAEKMQWVKLSPLEGMADSRRLDMDGGSLEVDVAPGKLDVGEDAVLKHIETSATAIVAYFGLFPVGRARILVVPVPDRGGSPQGTTWGGRGGFQGFTRLRVGEHTTQQDLDDDWVTTHELVHMTFPSQEDDHHWIEEGLATYVEPLARVKTGELTAKSVWTDMVRGMRQGEPGPGDQGLDHTHTWARTYWGGALFCLEADIEIRRQTGNKKGLQDALRAIAAQGGTIDQDWTLEKTFNVGDGGTGTHVLMVMYAAWKNAPVTVDLDKLWSELGIHRSENGLVFDETAPLAKIRDAIAGGS